MYVSLSDSKCLLDISNNAAVSVRSIQASVALMDCWADNGGRRLG